MDQVSPTFSEVHIETASWNNFSQPSTPATDVDIITTEHDIATEVCSVTVDGVLDTIERSASSRTLTPEVLPYEGDIDVETPIFQEVEADADDSVTTEPAPLVSSTAEPDIGCAEVQHLELDAHNAAKFPPKASANPGAGRVSKSRTAVTTCPKIGVTLEGATLWQEFCNAGTEMIITKSGRRMFPGIVVSLAGLEPDCKYSISLEVNPADNHRYKYLNSKWVVVGRSDAHCEEMLKHVHPDSPASGKHWMANKVAFKRVKITNNKNNRHGHITLNSMHRYMPKVVITKHLSKKSSAVIHSEDLVSCCFIAVTAYQNDQVTQLKIDYNPFAKAFRDNATDQEMFSYHGMMGVWHPSSPQLQPYPYSPDGLGPLQPGIPSPLLTPAGPSPLPQFSAAFGTWETPPYSPRTYMAAASPGALPSPTTAPVPDPRQFLWNTTSRLQQESPPMSPLLSSAGLHATQGSSVYQFPVEAAAKSPSALPTINPSSFQWQRSGYGVPYQVSRSPVGYGPSQPLQPSAFKPPVQSYLNHHCGLPLSSLQVPKMEPHPGSPQEPMTN